MRENKNKKTAGGGGGGESFHCCRRLITAAAAAVTAAAAASHPPTRPSDRRRRRRQVRETLSDSTSAVHTQNTTQQGEGGQPARRSRTDGSNARDASQSGDARIQLKQVVCPCRHTHINVSPHHRSSQYTMGVSHKATRHAIFYGILQYPVHRCVLPS